MSNKRERLAIVGSLAWMVMATGLILGTQKANLANAESVTTPVSHPDIHVVYEQPDSC